MLRLAYNLGCDGQIPRRCSKLNDIYSHCEALECLSLDAERHTGAEDAPSKIQMYSKLLFTVAI